MNLLASSGFENVRWKKKPSKEKKLNFIILSTAQIKLTLKQPFRVFFPITIFGVVEINKSEKKIPESNEMKIRNKC